METAEEVSEELAEEHVDYPHVPGYLYDCAACENSCHCGPGVAEGRETICVFEGHDGNT
jgi:hypothetical protein